MFVSGGDDYKIKVWNYNLKKCIYNMTGHTDYIRTVQFHHELPWIISASDDATIRVWNFQNRTLLSTAAGHEHYVMSAFFHPSQDLIVSASLDHSIRVWDYSVLRKKFFEARSNSIEVISMDITVKFKIDGHDKGVNWAVFHPTLQLIASGSDDKTIKIWKLADSKWSEADTLRGHHNNVSSVAFHPKYDYLISNSEDKTVRVWDLNKKSTIEKLTKENDRFWVLAPHPTLNIFASGSDSGLTVFKIENTRLPAACISNTILFYQNKAIKLWKFGETEKKKLVDVKVAKELRHGINTVLINPFVNIQQLYSFAVINNDEPRPGVCLFYAKNDGSNTKFQDEGVITQTTSLCFLSSNKCLTLTTSGNLVGYDTNNISNKFTFELLPNNNGKIEDLFQAPLGKFIIKYKNGIVSIIDANTKKTIQETNEITDLKFIVWNNNLTLGALVGEKSIFIVSKNMEILHKIKENSKIKSVCFDENNILFFTTDFHVKYCLQNGLNGIIKTTEITYYLMMVQNGTLYVSDALQNIKTENFNYTQCRFKISLFNKNYDDVVNILRSGAVFGMKAIENIQTSGFPDLSLKFVNDPKQKFYLALQSGKLEVDIYHNI
jgi:coatomer protein complex subunit alpha (xenin)